MKIQQKEKKIQLVLQLSSVELLYLQRKKKGGGGKQNKTMYKNPKYHCAYFLQGQNSRQLRTEVDFVFSTRRHTHTSMVV